MKDKTQRALRTFNSLPDAEKKEFLDAIKGYQETGTLNEQIRKDAGISMGPLPAGCPYCGR